MLITNTKGGCGKSTLTACLSEALQADIMDHDSQGTISINARLTGRHKPTKSISKQFVIHDTPPYNNAKLSSLAREVDLIIIPSKLMYADLLALATLADLIEKLRAEKKSIIVFNEVRYHNKKLNKEVRELFLQEYPKLRIAKTEIPNWIGFSKVLAEPLPKRELQQIKTLINELSAYKRSFKNV